MASFSTCDDRRRKSCGAAKKWILDRKCCCSGEKSVQVKEATSDLDNSSSSVMPKSIKGVDLERTLPTTNVPRHHRVSASGGFSFPILIPSITSNNNPAMIKGILKKSPINRPLEDPSRDSLEVFQPINDLPSFPGVENPAKTRHNLNTPESPVVREDEMCSDASSDLFEIESFSTQTTPYPIIYRRSDSFEEASTFNARRFADENQLGVKRLDEPPTPGVAPTECRYAPSEVSIDRSVTTAEGKFSVSPSSEMGISTVPQKRVQGEESSSTGEIGKRKGNGGVGLMLMSCRQEKAVNVGPPPVKLAPAEGSQNVAVHGGVRTPPPPTIKPPLVNSHSARLSPAFAA